MRHPIPDRASVIVIGAGTGGCTAARVAAAGGLRVVIVERASVTDIGRKVCGNAVTERDLSLMARGSVEPGGPEIATRVTRAILRAGPTALEIARPGMVLNRLLFGQRLLADALEMGATLVDECTCIGWSDRDANRIRLTWRDGREDDVEAQIIIDASGYSSVLTRHGGPLGRPEKIARNEVGIGYREIVPLLADLPCPDEATIVMTPDGAGDGYGWMLPMGARLANIGLGASIAADPARLRDSYRTFIESMPELRASEPLSQGTGMLPLRRPLPSLVGNGFMCVGDAACQTHPLHGGGIAPSIFAGALAGEQAVVALAEGDTSPHALWPYGLRFMREIGARHAAYDVLRRFLYSLGGADFTFLLARLVKSGGLAGALGAASGRPRAAGVFRAIATAARRPTLAGFIARAGNLVDATYRLYIDYPETPLRLMSWTGQVEYQKQAVARATERGTR